MGTLYTRSIGALSAKGQYIFPMDSDDMFLDKDVLSTITNISDKGNFDLVVFYTINSSLKPNINSTSYKIYNNKTERKANLVLFQPEMGYYPLRPYNKEYNVKKIETQCFSRCVRTKIYKNALNKLGKKRYSRHMLLGEDVITNYILFNTGRSMKYISKFGYLYVNRTGSVSKQSFDKLKLLRYRIYMLDDFILFSQNTFKHKKVVVTLALYCLNNESLKDVLKKNKYDYNLFISCLDKILKCKYISENDKNIIRKNGNFIEIINKSNIFK